jgi:hypothetical protein
VVVQKPGAALIVHLLIRSRQKNQIAPEVKMLAGSDEQHHRLK